VLERLRRVSVLLALLLAIAVVAAACGDDDDDDDAESGDATTTAAEGGDDSTTTAAEGDTSSSADDTATTEGAGGGTADLSSLSGEIIVTGSSTVEPISAAVAEAFNAAGADGVAIDVTGPGTGDGFQRFCAGEADVADASRPISEEEIALCEEGGISYVEIQVGIDALTVATNPANDAVSCLTIEDLYALVGPESTGFANWSDAQDLATELGSTTELPDAPLTIYGPGEESGTFDYFVEAVIEGIAEERGLPEEEWTTRPDYTASPNDNVIVEGIEADETSLGWVGFAYYQSEADRMKAIEIDGGDGCVAPSVETALDGSYPISRPLFIYVDSAKAAESPALAAFVDFYLGEGYSAVGEVGYAPLADDLLAEQVAAWEAR
jgi:phosphate transport system substrate-binding protein